MRDELLGHYERELSYLRLLGAEFAAKYPKVASRLLLEPEGSQDPHVERLIESVAFLTARLRHKIEDELPELTDSLLGLLYPHYLAPIPSMATVQFHLDPGQAQLTGAYEIPRGTVLTTRHVQGVRGRFRTGYPVHLWPLEVVDAGLEFPLTTKAEGPARAFRARSLIRIRLRTLGGLSLADVQPDTLRFFLHGESGLAGGLYEMICGGPCQVELHAPKAVATGRPVVLPRDAIRPAGFSADESLLPYPRHSFRGYPLLEEYFAFPEKFLYVDLAGLDRARDTGAVDEIEIRIFSSRTPGFEQLVQPSHFRLGCTPIVNLFEKAAEPIWIDHTKTEYLVVADVHAPAAHEVHSVDAVVSVGDDPADQRIFHPFYALRHASADAADCYWHAMRRQSLDGATDVYLSLVDGRMSATSPPTETLSLTVTCSNRDLPSQLPFNGSPGGDLDSEQVAPFVRVQCLNKPTPPKRREVGRGAHWQLMSHLALNYLSLVEQGKDALQAILELYDAGETAFARRQIAGIAALESTRVNRVINGAVCRGIKVTLTFDREHFVGTSPYLLASVIEHFLGLYAAINSFSQLTARTLQDEEPLGTWAPRAGEQIIL